MSEVALAVDVTDSGTTGEERGADLLARARADHRLFAEVYEEHALRVYRYVRTQVGSDDDAADLTAETFERAIRAIHTYRGTGSEIGWLLRIARHAVVDSARRRGRAALDPKRSRDTLEDAVDPADPPEASYLAAERTSQLRQAVAGLPAPAREAIALRYAVGLPTREIAALLGKSEAATQKLISRGLAALREDRHVER